MPAINEKPLSDKDFAALLYAREAAAEQAAAKRAAMSDKAATALTSSPAYLAIKTPSPEQTTQQVADLTKQVESLTRLVLGLLDN